MKRSQPPANDDQPDRIAERRRFVDTQIRGRGITSTRVIDAMLEVPRHCFVAPDLAEAAYDDNPLPIGHGQTISQPYMVAMMADAAMLEPGDHVLEVGTGSGYGAAVLSRLAASVVTVERHGPLASAAATRLAELGYTNVAVVEGDGTLGRREHAPFDAIVVTAAGPSVPEVLHGQLVDGGRLIMPIGGRPGEQRLVRVTRLGGRYEQEDLGGVRFVPLVGRYGLDEPSDEA